jgi:hypothetical protein
MTATVVCRGRSTGRVCRGRCAFRIPFREALASWYTGVADGAARAAVVCMHVCCMLSAACGGTTTWENLAVCCMLYVLRCMLHVQAPELLLRGLDVVGFLPLQCGLGRRVAQLEHCRRCLPHVALHCARCATSAPGPGSPSPHLRREWTLCRSLARRHRGPEFPQVRCVPRVPAARQPLLPVAAFPVSGGWILCGQGPHASSLPCEVEA